MSGIAATRTQRYLFVAFFLGAFIGVVVTAPTANAYLEYSQNKDNTNCRRCHGNFRANPYVSLVDGMSWGDDAHDVHRRVMLNSDCNTCHGSGGNFPVLIGESAGGAGFPAIGCVGCHGREADTGNDSISFGYGAGLRQHHTNAGVMDCIGCHDDADPANYTPVGEDVLPDYYFMPDPDLDHPDKPTNSCSPNGEEDYAGSMTGLDNDGNGLYDGNDPACAAAECGNGTIEPGEDCDDGNTLDGDCCSASCQFEPVGSACPDGEFCNGVETCDGAGSCQAGTPVDCSDSVDCTDDSCDEVNDVCVNDQNDFNCTDDGLFCTGDAFCDAVMDCSFTGDPCDVGSTCNEGTDTCDSVPGCGDGIVDPDEDCDDGNVLDGDCCSATCQFEPVDSPCPDGLYCNGDETCDGAGTCQAGTPVDCSDGVGCTDDSCDEVNDVCVNNPNDTNCADDGLFCTGDAFCDAEMDCSATGDPCVDGTVCNDATNTCDAQGGGGGGCQLQPLGGRSNATQPILIVLFFSVLLLRERRRRRLPARGR